MPLRPGDRGPPVTAAQKRLNQTFAGAKSLSENGVYDDPTRQRVAAFQKASSLASSGVIDDITNAVLFGEDFEFELFRPRPVMQDSNQYLCWASALESWIEVQIKQVMRSSEELIALMTKGTGYLGERDGLTARGWGHAVQLLGLGFASFGARRGTTPLDQLTISFLYQKMKQKGHLVIAYNITPSLAHTVVGYGVTLWFNPYDPDDRGTRWVNVMDPWNGGGKGGLRVKDIAAMKANDYVLVMWSR